MSYWVAIDPEIMRDKEFVELWNADESCVQAARAELNRRSDQAFEPVTAAILVSVASGLTTAAIIALMKKLFSKQNPAESVEIIVRREPDGTETLIARKEKR